MRRILFVVNVDWFFISHRLPVAIEAIQQGYDVHVACADTGRCGVLEASGLTVHRLSMSRSGTKVLAELRVFYLLCKLIRRLKPDIVHGVTVKPIVYSSVITKLIGKGVRVFSISGLGYIFTDNSFRARVIRLAVSLMYRFGLNDPLVTVIFQNASDKEMFIKSGIVREKRSFLIPGSGVSLQEYQFSEFEGSRPKVLFVGRLLRDKGVVEFCEAARLLKRRCLAAEFLLAGDIDRGNPNSMTLDEIAQYVNEGTVVHLGHRDDIPEIIASCSMVVLPSYREGLPKSLIEAAACGRAVVTTDVPGCRDAIVPGRTGVLVPVKNVSALALAIERLLLSPEEAAEMGRRGRELAEKLFSIETVVRMHLEIYEDAK